MAAPRDGAKLGRCAIARSDTSPSASDHEATPGAPRVATPHDATSSPSRGRFALWAQYLFFLRFPLLLGLVLFALPFVALFLAENLLGNLFVLGWGQVFLVSWFAASASWVVMITVRLIVRSAPARFRVAPLPVPGWLRRFAVPLSALLAVPMLWALVTRSAAPLGVALAAAGGGVALALVILYTAAACQKLAAGGDEPDPDLVLRTDRGLLGLMPRRGLAPGSGAAAGPTVGYRSTTTGRMLPGHLLGVAFLFLTLVVYFTGYFAFQPDGEPWFPSLGYVLLILLVVGWALPGASFALDRYRVPVLLLLVLLSFVVNTVFHSDHYYEVLPAESARQDRPSRGVTPGEAFAAADRRQGVERSREGQPAEPDVEGGPEADRSQEPRPADGAGPPVVLVAASGGGITASLWTATVLTGLQADVGPEVTRSIRLLSSVSGGSAGALFFLDRIGPDGAPPPDALAEIREAAGASSLDGVSWGLAYPDLWRAFFPFLVRDPFKDRGWALEELWRERLERPDATLDDWRRRMEAGELPAAVFNSTVVETGEQLLLTPLEGFAPQAVDFLGTYGGYDLPVATGARLSASFPWVSPVARPRTWDGEPLVLPPWHGADGGYYDNFGVVSVVSWILSLGEADLAELRERGVVLVRIRASPPAGPPNEGAEPADRGWIYSAVGPLITLLNVRTATQDFRNDVDVRLLAQLAAGKGIPVTCATFTLEAESPLSWKLTDRQRDTIVAGWEEKRNCEALCQVRKAFGWDVACCKEPRCSELDTF